MAVVYVQVSKRTLLAYITPDKRDGVGMHFAEASLFVNMTGILVAFDILRPLNEFGEDLVPLLEFTSAILRFVMLPTCQ